MCYIPNQQYLLLSTHNGRICAFSIEQRKLIFTNISHNFACHDLLCWGDNLCISCSTDSKSCIQIMEIISKYPYYKILKTVKGVTKKDNILSICMLRMGVIVTGSDRGLLKVRNMKTPTCISLGTIKIANNDAIIRIIRIVSGLLALELRSGVIKIISIGEKEAKFVSKTLSGIFARIYYS